MSGPDLGSSVVTILQTSLGRGAHGRPRPDEGSYPQGPQCRKCLRPTSHTFVRKEDD